MCILYIYVYIYMYTYIYVYLYICLCIYISSSSSIFMYIHTYIYVNIVYGYLHISASMYLAAPCPLELFRDLMNQRPPVNRGSCLFCAFARPSMPIIVTNLLFFGIRRASNFVF